jgi:hypothetical protein
MASRPPQGTFLNAGAADVPLAQPGQLFDPGMTRAQFRLDSMPESASAAARPPMRGCSRLLLDQLRLARTDA